MKGRTFREELIAAEKRIKAQNETIGHLQLAVKGLAHEKRMLRSDLLREYNKAVGFKSRLDEVLNS